MISYARATCRFFSSAGVTGSITKVDNRVPLIRRLNILAVVQEGSRIKHNVLDNFRFCIKLLAIGNLVVIDGVFLTF